MFYAYILSDKKGIVEDWESCKALVNGVSGAIKEEDILF